MTTIVDDHGLPLISVGPSWWLEVRGNPTVGWREYVDDPLPAAAHAAAELGRAVSVHDGGCQLGQSLAPPDAGPLVAMEGSAPGCSCSPRIVQPAAAS